MLNWSRAVYEQRIKTGKLQLSACPKCYWFVMCGIWISSGGSHFEGSNFLWLPTVHWCIDVYCKDVTAGVCLHPPSNKNKNTHLHFWQSSLIHALQCPSVPGEIDLNPEVGILTLTFNVDIEVTWVALSATLFFFTWAACCCLCLLQIEYEYAIWLGMELEGWRNSKVMGTEPPAGFWCFFCAKCCTCHADGKFDPNLAQIKMIKHCRSSICKRVDVFELHA